MSNQLNMAEVSAIETLRRTGKSRREIARLLGLHQETVGKYVAALERWLVEGADQNRPDHPAGGAPPLGSIPDDAGPADQNQPNLLTGLEPEFGGAASLRELRALLPDSPPGPLSVCEPHREFIRQQVERGLTAARIHQDLVREHGFTAHYHSMRRFVAKLRAQVDLPVRRLESDPGWEAQVDFGVGAPVRDSDGRVRRPWVLRVVLSASRKAHSEAVGSRRRTPS